MFDTNNRLDIEDRLVKIMEWVYENFIFNRRLVYYMDEYSEYIKRPPTGLGEVEDWMLLKKEFKNPFIHMVTILTQLGRSMEVEDAERRLHMLEKGIIFTAYDSGGEMDDC